MRNFYFFGALLLNAKKVGSSLDGREIQLGRFSQGMTRVFSAFDIQGAVPSSEILKPSCQAWLLPTPLRSSTGAAPGSDPSFPTSKLLLPDQELLQTGMLCLWDFTAAFCPLAGTAVARGTDLVLNVGHSDNNEL